MHVAKSEKRKRKYIFRDSWLELYEKIEKQPPEMFYKKCILKHSHESTCAGVAPENNNSGKFHKFLENCLCLSFYQKITPLFYLPNVSEQLRCRAFLNNCFTHCRKKPQKHHPEVFCKTKSS